MAMRIKRAMDVAMGIVALILTLPLWAAIAAAIRLDSPGPVLFRQLRVTKDGAVFKMYKFRTMVAGSQSIPSGGSLDRTVPFFKSRDDPQVTRLGRILRETSLDELPQLWNVIRGDMSLVGPRPPLPEEVESYEQDWHFDRLEVLPGITGLWQVSGRSNLSFDDY
ncbi:MAG TPA: sugar transferase, partial [Actinomycetota bacterium]